MIVFSVCAIIGLSLSLMILKHHQVDGQGFKVDAARLASHSQFLDQMIFNNDGHIGGSREGTISNPIVVEGCTSTAFANFLGWLNHKYVSLNTHINHPVLIHFIFGKAPGRPPDWNIVNSSLISSISPICGKSCRELTLLHVNSSRSICNQHTISTSLDAITWLIGFPLLSESFSQSL